MESNWAAEHLQVIRTLMERSAVYRRALAPIMTFNGVLGVAAGVIGWAAKINSPQGFIAYWAGVGLSALGGSFLLVRRQALKESEPFWSPPTRRIAQALLPALFVGSIAGILAFVCPTWDFLQVQSLAPFWMVLSTGAPLPRQVFSCIVESNSWGGFSFFPAACSWRHAASRRRCSP